jgi:hypothetical protein
MFNSTRVRVSLKKAVSEQIGEFRFSEMKGGAVGSERRLYKSV